MKETDVMGVIEGVIALQKGRLLKIPFSRIQRGSKPMSAKDVRFSTDARDRMVRGVDTLTTL